MFKPGVGDVEFGFRYATAGQELSRDIKTFTETLVIPDTGLVPNESFTHPFALALQDTGDGGGINSGDVTVSAGNVIITTGNVPVATISLTATANVAIGGALGLDYTGREVLTAPTFTTGGLGLTVDFALANTVLGTGDGGGITTADIPVISGNVLFSSFNAGTNTVTFVVTADLAAGSQITVQYRGREALTVPITGVFNGEPFNLDLNLDHLPLQDTDGSSTVATADITISGVPADQTPQLIVGGLVVGGLSVAGLSNAASGAGQRRRHSPGSLGRRPGRGHLYQVTYLGLADLVTVKGSTGVPVPLRMRETGPDTGVYVGDVIAVDGSAGQADVLNSNLDPTNTGSGQSPHIAVIDGGAVTVTFDDRNPVRPGTARVQVEVEPPSFSEISPASGDTVNVLTTNLTAETIDNLAGVDPSTNLLNDDTPESVTIVILDSEGFPETIITGDITVTETFSGSGVFTVSYGIDNIPVIAAAIADGTEIATTITWTIEVKDKAGNKGYFPAQPLTIDNRSPELSNVFVGDNWDPNQPEGQRLRGSRSGLPVTDVRTSIRVVFDRPMDGTGFQTADFDITTGGGSVAFKPTKVDFFSSLPDSVFLTVPQLAPDARPKVEVVGEVIDKGGNILDITDALAAIIEQASDGIAPKLTASIVDSFTKADIVLLATADEPIVGSLPGRTVTRCTGSLTTCTGAAAFTTSSSILVSQRQWSFDLRGFGIGRYNLGLSAQDSSGNVGALGTGTGDPTAAGAISFEIDNNLPTFTSTSPAAGASADQSDLFITDISLGDHTLTFNGTDELRNTRTNDEELSFTVVARATFDVTLVPGLSLVSIPGEPLNGAIDTVFAGLTEVDLVFTREGDQWLVALRNPATGLFEGNLSTIDAKHAYWVRASVTVTLKVDIPPQGAHQLLPTIDVKGNAWNLVPVISLLPVDKTPEGSTVDADTYFGANWTKSAFTFDRGRWQPVVPAPTQQRLCSNPDTPANPPGTCGTEDGASPGEFFTLDDQTNPVQDGIQIGRGYWVWFDKDETLTP